MLAFTAALLLAHGQYPLAYQLLAKPGTPGGYLAGTSFGVLLSRDDGASWQYVCDEAIGYPPAAQPVWVVTGSGKLLGGDLTGLYVSTDEGCTWSQHPTFAPPADGGMGPGVADLTSQGGTLYAASAKYGVSNALWRSTDEGATWAQLPVASNALLFTTVRVAPSRPARVYAAAWWFRPDLTAFLFRSDDGGDAFTRVDVTTALPVRGSFRLMAVSPDDPDVLYAAVQTTDPLRSYFVRSADRGDTWTPLFDTEDLLRSAVIAPGGLWVSADSRIFHSTDGVTFAPLASPTRWACIDRLGGHNYACGWPEVDGYAIAELGSSGQLQPLLTWQRISSVAHCPGTHVEATCTPLFSSYIKATLPPSPPLDAGSVSEPVDAGVPPTLVTPAPSGCSTAPTTLAAMALALVAMAWASQRRR
ncbi:MAG: hypothetical protein IPJ65_21630 [Archangiaceae bacterium]|nr:hypothetical protein [Archangiaceae bacterium]